MKQQSFDVGMDTAEKTVEPRTFDESRVSLMMILKMVVVVGLWEVETQMLDQYSLDY